VRRERNRLIDGDKDREKIEREKVKRKGEERVKTEIERERGGIERSEIDK